MVTRAYPTEYINKSKTIPTQSSNQVVYQPYIPREYWIMLGIAIAGLTLALIIAVYYLGKKS